MRWLVFLLFGLSLVRADERADAFRLIEKQRYAEAEEILDAVLQKRPDDVETLEQRGKLAQMRGDRVGAVDFFRRAAALRPADARLQFYLGAASCQFALDSGVSWRTFGLTRRGRAALEQAVALDPDELTYRQALFEFYRRAPLLLGGSERRAEEQAAAIAARDVVQGTFARAALALDQENVTEAIALWRALADQPRAPPVAFLEIGRIAATTGRHVADGIRALEHWQRLERPARASDRADAFWYLGKLYAHRGDVQAARQAFAAGLVEAPQHRGMTADLAALPRD